MPTITYIPFIYHCLARMFAEKNSLYFLQSPEFSRNRYICEMTLHI